MEKNNMKRFTTIMIVLVVSGYILVKEYEVVTALYIIAGVLFLQLLFSLLFGGLKKRRMLRKSFKKIDQMTGIEFEEYLMYQFKSLGYKAEMTAESGDFGADLLLRKKRKLYVVQAKRYSGSVGIKAVQEVIGAMSYYDGDYGMVITNSYYTKAAKDLAEASNIELWERADLKEHFHIPGE